MREKESARVRQRVNTSRFDFKIVSFNFLYLNMNKQATHFKNWCFLCSRDESVITEIVGLGETIRETIGQFSFLVSFVYN